MKFQKSIPIPNERLSFNWSDMSVGDSLFLEGKKSTEIGGRLTFPKKVLGYKMTTRTVVENGVKGVRIWRTA